MTSKSAAAEFNQVALDLLDDLCGVLPENDDLAGAKLLASTLHSTNPNNTLALNTFRQHAGEYRDVLASGDAERMVEVVRGLFPDAGVVDEFWGQLTAENKEVVGRYAAALGDIAFGSEDGCGAASDEGSAAAKTDHAIYLLYNTAWRDLLVSFDETTGVVDKIDKLLSVKGKDSDVLFCIMDSVMDKVRVETISAANVTDALIPPKDIQKACKNDIKRVGASTVLPLDTTRTVGWFLEMVVSTQRTWLMWHYLKTMVAVAKTCPPEVQMIMNDLIAGSDLF